MTRSLPQLRIALLLGAGAIFATAAVFPYLLASKPDVLAVVEARLHVSPGVVVTLQSIQLGVLSFLLGWAGLKLGAPLGLGAPWLAHLLYGRPRPRASSWLLAAVLGILGAALIVAAIAWFGAPFEQSGAIQTPAPWKGLLASPYGAIVEETLLRVFIMGAIAWLLAHMSGGMPRAWLMIAAILIASVLFGIGHLPMAAQLAPLSAAIVTRVIVYNSVGGLVFGALYWKRGLEHAMLAHLCADIVLHVAAPVLPGH